MCTPPPLKDSFIPEQITLIKNNENEGRLSSVVQTPLVFTHRDEARAYDYVCNTNKSTCMKIKDRKT
jgi:hypothetical protein